MIETYISEDLRAMFSMDYYLEETEDKHQTYILYSVDKELAQALVKDTATTFHPSYPSAKDCSSVSKATFQYNSFIQQKTSTRCNGRHV